MELHEIMKLLDAGFSKEEILAMENKAKEEPKIEETEVHEEPKKEGNPFDSQVITDALGEIKTVFDDFKKELTAMNIMNSRIDPEKSSDDILAEIINPFSTDNK